MSDDITIISGLTFSKQLAKIFDSSCSGGERSSWVVVECRPESKEFSRKETLLSSRCRQRRRMSAEAEMHVRSKVVESGACMK